MLIAISENEYYCMTNSINDVIDIMKDKIIFYDKTNKKHIYLAIKNHDITLEQYEYNIPIYDINKNYNDDIPINTLNNIFSNKNKTDLI